ncbi:MAG TPA: DMT family transporter [Candidatus Thermoplasmatota archaeon]|nr:DMT family transporter [Candidatus Thermoplasmatota archaeon]
MVAPAAGLGTAAAWGAGDFSGGLAARRQPVVVVVFLSQLIGSVLIGAAALLSREAMPAATDLLWGAAAGLAGAVGVTALYAALSMGRMGIAAPITGVVAAVLPVAYAWTIAGAPSALGLAGVGLALAGIVLVSGPKAERPPPRVLALALVSGLGFASFLLLMGLSGGSYFWTLTAARGGSAFVLLVIVLVVRQTWGKPSWWVLGAALGDTLGNAFFLIAARLGRLDVAVVLSALYPIATVLLARLVLKEKLTRTQAWGAALMLAAIPLVALS